MQARESTRATAATVLRVTSGNFLEMFDFFLYGFFAAPIGAAFFPARDETTRLLVVFVTFGVSFLMRPVGALVLGAYIDRVGRRRGLILTLAIMAVGTAVIAGTPSVAWFSAISPSLAPVAPVLVILGRLAQGFSAGVELGGVSVYLAEIAPPHRRGFFTSFQSASQQVAIMLAAAIGFALERVLSREEIATYGWRIPFAIGCLIVPVILLLRRSLAETEAFRRQRVHPSPRETLATLVGEARLVLAGMSLVVMTTVSFYLITVYTPTFGRQVLHLSASDALLVTLAVAVSNFIWLPVMGAASDRVGRKPILVLCAIAMLASAYPALAWLAAAPSSGKMLAVELWLSLLYASYNGAMVVALTEIVPMRVRTSGFSLAYSLATALFGSFTPAVCEELIARTADKAAPGIWLAIAAGISLAAALTIREPRGKEVSNT